VEVKWCNYTVRLTYVGGKGGHTYSLEPEFLNFQGPQASIPRNRSIPCKRIEGFRIVIVIGCVSGKVTPTDQHISNMQPWQLSAGDEKSTPALKIK
jgi:hypothetical protein